MNELDKIVSEVPSDSLKIKSDDKKVSVNDIIEFFTDKDTEKNAQIIAGRVFQKNKKLNFTETFFKLYEEEIKKIETKNNKDLDNSFFNLNKKILSNNIYYIKEIINLYGLDEKRLIMFLVGTLIQSIYDEKN
jgi:kynurenine formamidase